LGYPHLWRPPYCTCGVVVSFSQVADHDARSALFYCAKTPKLVQLLSSTATLAGDPDAKLSHVAAAFSCNNAPSLHQTNTQWCTWLAGLVPSRLQETSPNLDVSRMTTLRSHVKVPQWNQSRCPGSILRQLGFHSNVPKKLCFSALYSIPHAAAPRTIKHQNCNGHCPFF